ncbi:sporulation integral membrane protein YtvI [Alicyclobacillus acidiphilus]|uniref:sporulation integral membrane protein YtvI n=1 Tax=Alicyclobacillus acidiphilus TaxID=182455 RepID=UPI00157B62E7|nr:sporulation integral membrane protein YtvI [Alicyclobacillus acidiphilus]
MLAFIALVVVTLTYLMKYIMPFVIGWVFAILLIPIERWVERRGIRRMPAVLIVMIFAVLLALAISIGLIIGTLREASSFVTHSESFFRDEMRDFRRSLASGQALFGQLPPQIANSVQSAAVQFSHSVEASIHKVVTSIVSIVAHLPDTLFIFVISVITAFFILLRREQMLAFVYRLMPPGWAPKLDIVFADMERAFLGTIRVQFILMCMSAVLGVTGMLILHFPYAVLLGILFALTGLVPILGSALLTVPWAIGALLVGDTSTAVKVLALQVVISLIRHAIEPKILADSVGLNTLTTLFGLYVGLKALGILGLFLGPIMLIGARGLLSTRLFVDFLPQEKIIIARDGDDPGGE